MFYDDVLEHLKRDKRNPINQMYLHEIGLMWDEVEKSIKEGLKSGKNDSMLNELNNFTEAISNKKYRYDKVKLKGFHAESPLFSPYYLADILTVLFKRTGVLKNHGIKWGFQRFDLGIKYMPTNLVEDEKRPELIQRKSDKFAMLTKQIDFQYRIAGRRNFEKSAQVYPLIIFGLYKRLDQENFIHCNEQARLAKIAFPKCKFVIIAETLREDFVPDINKSEVEILYVLRKQFFNLYKKKHKLALDVMNVIEKKIMDYLTFKERNRADIFKSRGIIE